ncbi:hypothetical protein BDK92_2230 [Micromonospora pisi]|uniref:Uncharacterized protein n=1 Tax=Micromonospora pisi TaxID=589240 RepID=A0A495JGA0_9ACTN|nr:hypothetical protein [Micromonospora pisi]RKR87927.1 hypothetical protein BDK92_2230 [Micromonospora pisi]
MFDAYTILLMVSGLLLVAVGAALSGQGVGARVLTVVVGLGFFGYGFYLEFLFEGGTYRIFFYAFIFPVLLTVRAVKSWSEKRDQAAQPVAPQQPEHAPQEGR